MISLALVVLSLTLLICGKAPLLGGKVIRGVKVRSAGALILALSICSFFLSTNASVTLIVLIIVGMVCAYFFTKGEDPTEKESKMMLFTSARDEKKEYSTAIFGLCLVGLIMFSFGGVVWLLLKLIRG